MGGEHGRCHTARAQAIGGGHKGVPLSDSTVEAESVPRPTGKCPVADVAWKGPAREALSGHKMLDELREKGPLFQIPGPGPRGGFYLITEHETALRVAQDAKTFPQPSHIMETGEPMAFKLIPEFIDAPEHTKWRRLLAPYFSPGKIEAWNDRIRQRANQIIDGLIDKGECDFVNDFALRYPTAIFLEFAGLPLDRLEDFLKWEDNILHPAHEDPAANAAQMERAQGEVTKYFVEVIAERRAMAPEERPAGLITEALDWTIDGEPVPDHDLLLFYLLLFMAGLDTVTAELGYGFLHLATHPEDRQRIVDSPEIIPRATEELLRAYPIVNTYREAAVDTEIAGCPISAGDFVYLSYPSAGRDDAIYPDAQKVDFDRENITHLSFGAGPHRCLGSHLARHELTIAYEEWHKRIPAYELREDVEFTEASSGMFTLNSLPLRWDAPDRGGSCPT